MPYFKSFSLSLALCLSLQMSAFQASMADTVYTPSISYLPSIEMLESVTVDQAQMIERNFKNGRINLTEKSLVLSNLDNIKVRLQKVKARPTLDSLEIRLIRSQLTKNYKLTSRLAKNSDLYVSRL